MKTPPMALDTREEWFDLARTAITELAATRHLFTADDLRPLVPDPGHKNWIGNAFQSARQTKLIKPVGFQLSNSKSRKHGVIRVWTPVLERDK